MGTQKFINLTFLCLYFDNNSIHTETMKYITKFLLMASLLFFISCSADYEKMVNKNYVIKNQLSKHIFDAYKIRAKFEAEEMHDWNAAKLYAKKALNAANYEKILPEKVDYWKLPNNKLYEISKAYDNLMIIYEDAILLDPFNLAKAISSLDCWSEQQEENWQTWDINACRDDFLDAMHSIYKAIKDDDTSNIVSNEKNDSATLVTQDDQKNILQIIYFDFDKSNLTSVSLDKINKFINENKELIKNFLIIGHTDTIGSKKYNQKLSIERANTVKKVLVNIGINSDRIKVLGRGEEVLSVHTDDETPHPANRRAEISPLN